MAITPGAGYMIDPNNPNGVIPISSAPQTPVVTTPTIADNHSSLTQSLIGAGADATHASALAGAAVTPTDNTYAKASGYTGNSVQDFLSTAGMPSDLASRSTLATKYGISNYTGTADQNLQLLHILQGHNTSVSDTGVPHNIGSVLGVSTSSPTPKNPLDLPNLTGSGMDLGAILGAGVGANAGVPSDIAGLLSLYDAHTKSQADYEKTNSELLDAMKSLGGESADLTTELGTQGVTDAYTHVKQLNLDAARLKGELDSFDAATEQGKSNIEGQQIPLGLIQGQQAAFQKQRDLTRIAKAAELSGVIALSTAYQGNAELGMKLATNAIDMKYAPILNNIKVLQQQSTIAGNAMQADDAKNTKIISALLDYKAKQIDAQKTNDLKLQTIGVQAASGGATLSAVQAALKGGDPVAAASALSQWLKGPTETVTTSTDGSVKFSATQINNGAANSGLPVATFQALDHDTQNYFINTYGSSQLAKDVQAVQSGGETSTGGTKDEVISNIRSSNLPDAVKAIILKSLGADLTATASENSGGFSGSIFGNTFSGAAAGIRSWWNGQ